MIVANIYAHLRDAGAKNIYIANHSPSGLDREAVGPLLPAFAERPELVLGFLRRFALVVHLRLCIVVKRI